MFILPLVILAIAGFAVYTVMHRRSQPATSVIHGSAVQQQKPFWPTTIQGKVGIGALALTVLANVLINVILAPYLTIVTLPAALVLTGIARFAKHDHSTSVLITFGVSALATLAGLLFLAGEVFIGHD